MPPRDELIESYGPLVRSIADDVARKLGFERDREDLVAAGFEGLLDAHARFDPAKGAKFSTFAHYRIHGAIVDQVRNSSRLPRSAQALAKRLALAGLVAEQAGEQRAQRPDADAAEDALADAIHDLLGQLTTSYVTAAVADEERGGTPEEAVLSQLERARVRKVVGGLPEREQRVIRGVYFAEEPLDDIGSELGVSRGRVSQLHSQALDLLRKRLG